MHDRLISVASDWIGTNIGTSTSKEELVRKSSAADLPPEVHEAIRELPDGHYQKAEVVSAVREALLLKLGAADAAMRGFGGSM